MNRAATDEGSKEDRAGSRSLRCSGLNAKIPTHRQGTPQVKRGRPAQPNISTRSIRRKIQSINEQISLTQKRAKQARTKASLTVRCWREAPSTILLTHQHHTQQQAENVTMRKKQTPNTSYCPAATPNLNQQP